MLSQTDAAGVKAALVILPSAVAQDLTHPLAAAADHPDRIVVVAEVEEPDEAADVMLARLRATSGIRGIRVILWREEALRPVAAGAFDAVFASAERHELPLMTFTPHAPQRSRGHRFAGTDSRQVRCRSG